MGTSLIRNKLRREVRTVQTVQALIVRRKYRFRLIKDHAESKGFIFRQAEFRLDFETSTIKAIEEVFPAAVIKGCNFHFCQCVWRKVQRCGLTTFFETDQNVKRFIKCLMAMSLVPVALLDDAWLAIDADSPNASHPAYAAMNDLKEYFINTWMENPQTFPRDLWNHFGNTGARTTNHLEAWHRTLNARIKQAHVNLFDLVTHLKREEHNTKIQRIFLDAGNPPPPMRRKYRVLNDRLSRLMDELQNPQNSLIDYIKNVAHITPDSD